MPLLLAASTISLFATVRDVPGGGGSAEIEVWYLRRQLAHDVGQAHLCAAH